MIKTVIFDVDNTLYSYDKANAAAFEMLAKYAKEKLGLTRELFEGLHAETMRDLEEYMGDVAAVHNRTIRYQHLLENRGLPLCPHVLEMDALYWDTFLHQAEPFAGVLEALKLLKEQGIRIGIGTNMTARIQFKKLEKLGLLPYVDFLVSSEEAGIEKPSEAFFSRCVTKAGCEARECLFVGDSLEKDVLGAIAAGLKAAWYCPDGKQPGVDVTQIIDMAKLPQIVSIL